MRIILDGKKLAMTLRTSKDILTLIKGLAHSLHWKTLYDPAKEIVYISTIHAEFDLSDLTTDPPLIEDLESVRFQGKSICIDPGHGGNDAGAVGPSGTCEKDNTLAIAVLLKEKLENNGATVWLTRYLQTERSAEDQQQDLAERLQSINDSGADFFISIHNDAFADSRAAGTTTFHYGNEQSVALCNHVQKSLVETLGTRDRGSRFASFYLLRCAQIPGILIEAAFISNPEEEVLLASTEGRNKIAAAIYEGVAQYLKI